MKDAGIRIRVEADLRTAFVAACRAENKRASDLLRDFMEAFVARHQGGQGDLFLVRRNEKGGDSSSRRKVSRVKG